MSLRETVSGFRTLSGVLPYTDLMRYRRIRKAAGGEAEFFRIKQLGWKAVACRPGTTDHQVLLDTFSSLFHLPPENLPADPIILDLGANVGYTAAHFAELFPTATVYAVEMDERNAEMARRNTEQFRPRVSIIHCAVWIENGVMSYGGGEDGEWAYRLEGLGGAAGRYTVATQTLDALCEAQGIGRIDFLKMDIEGAESRVLREHTEWLDRVQRINLEVHGPMVLEEAIETLTRHGFECRRHPTHIAGVLGVRRASK